jgi:hypothetical protein
LEVVMTGTRGLALALILFVAAPAVAAQSRSDPRQPQTRRDDQRSDPRDRWNPRATPRFDLAFNNGFDDGYEAGLRDARKGDRFDPIREKRYRSGDHGYDRRYGAKDLYKNRYRDAFRRGYADGSQDGRRYDRGGPPRWWPFGR